MRFILLFLSLLDGRSHLHPLVSHRKQLHHGSAQSSSFVQDGLSFMEPLSLFRWVVRALLGFVVYVMSQFPARFNVTVDPDVFIRSITIQVNGQMVSSERWSEAPRVVPWDADTAVLGRSNLGRVDGACRWAEYCQDMLEYVPSLHGGMCAPLSSPCVYLARL